MTIPEEIDLRDYYSKGMSVKEIATILQRQRSGVSSRLVRLGLNTNTSINLPNLAGKVSFTNNNDSGPAKLESEEQWDF